MLPGKSLCSFSGARVKPTEDFLRARGQARFVVFVAGLACQLGKCRVSVDCRRDCAETETGLHCQHKLVQQIASVRRNNGCAENFIAAFDGENFRKTGFFALDDCAIDIFERDEEQIAINISLLRLFFAETDMRDFWIDIRAPRHDRVIHFLSEKLEGREKCSARPRALAHRPCA